MRSSSDPPARCCEGGVCMTLRMTLPPDRWPVDPTAVLAESPGCLVSDLMTIFWSERRMITKIQCRGSQPSGRGPADGFTGTVCIDPDPLCTAQDSHGRAHAASRPGPHRTGGRRPCAAGGQSCRGHSPWGPRVVRAQQAALGRRGPDLRQDTHHRSGISGWQGRGLAGTRQ